MFYEEGRVTRSRISRVTRFACSHRDRRPCSPLWSADRAHASAGQPRCNKPGVMDFGENRSTSTHQKHTKSLPCVDDPSMKQNNAILWIRDKLWQSFQRRQKQGSDICPRRQRRRKPKRAFELENVAAKKLEKRAFQDRRRFVASQALESGRPLPRPKLDRKLGPACGQINPPDSGR